MWRLTGWTIRGRFCGLIPPDLSILSCSAARASVASRRASFVRPLSNKWACLTPRLNLPPTMTCGSGCRRDAASASYRSACQPPGCMAATKRAQVFRETLRLLQRHYAYLPFQWVYSYCCYLVDRWDQFYEPLRPSIPKYCLSLPLGCWYNRARIGPYWREWRSVMRLDGLIHRCKESRIIRALGPHLRR